MVHGSRSLHFLAPVLESKKDSGTSYHFRFEMSSRGTEGVLTLRTRVRLEPGDSLAFSADSMRAGVALGTWKGDSASSLVVAESGYVKVHKSPIGDILHFKFWGQGREDTIPLQVGGSFYKLTRVPIWLGRRRPGP